MAIKLFDYVDKPDVERVIKEFEREYQNLKTLAHPSIIQFFAFDHIPAECKAYLRMKWASTELSDTEIKGNVDLGDIVCHRDGLHVPGGKLFLPEAFIWHVLFHLSAALSLCHHGIEIQRKEIIETTNAGFVLNLLTKTPPDDLRLRAAQHPMLSWSAERITFSAKKSHKPILHRDIKPRNSKSSHQKDMKDLNHG